MASDADCLLLLKDAIATKKEIFYSNASGPCNPARATNLVIGDKTFPKSTPTRYRKQGATNEFYTLDAIYFAWNLKDAAAGEYMKQARDSGLTFGFVNVTERKPVVDWLDGRVSDSDRIAPLAAGTTTPPGSPTRQPPQTSHTPVASRTGPGQTTTPAKRKYVVDQRDLELVKKMKANENFSNVRILLAEKLKKAKEASRAPTTPANPAQDPKMLARKSRNNQPIIMISSAPTALITMHNVKRFLQEASFEPSKDARSRAQAEGNTRAEDLIPIYRKRTIIDASSREHEIQSKYLVVDSVEALLKLGNDAWDRVVCVMTTGQDWQFRQYKWPEPLQLFHHVKGVYLSFSNEPPNPKIKDWNVTELKIDPYRRHVDKAVVAQFWKILDAWIATNKPGLLKA